ncbi:transcriptional repressor [bacterium]|nr:transcriptional repressor [bacterium]
MNYSRQREIITNALETNVVHPTAEALYEIIKKSYPEISKATLYRNLSQLADLGMIKKIEGLEASAHFDHNTHLHYHFICEKCGKVFDVSSEVASNVVNNTENETGFRITSHELVFHGLCKECQ